MKQFLLTIEGFDYSIEVSKDALMVNGRPFHVQVNDRKVIVDGVEHHVELGKGVAWVNGFRYVFSFCDGNKGLVQDGHEITQDTVQQLSLLPMSYDNYILTAVMPGRVLRILVKEGDVAQTGDVLCILEAMKMENELRAHEAGIVQQILVKPGQSVDVNEPLIIFERRACASNKA